MNARTRAAESIFNAHFTMSGAATAVDGIAAVSGCGSRPAYRRSSHLVASSQVAFRCAIYRTSTAEGTARSAEPTR
jgi:hypothetical protein